jgi:hypothetical protein
MEPVPGRDRELRAASWTPKKLGATLTLITYAWWRALSTGSVADAVGTTSMTRAPTRAEMPRRDVGTRMERLPLDR